MTEWKQIKHVHYKFKLIITHYYEFLFLAGKLSFTSGKKLMKFGLKCNYEAVAKQFFYANIYLEIENYIF